VTDYKHAVTDSEPFLPALVPCEELLTDPEELYLRQVTATNAQGDMVGEGAFKPPFKKKGQPESPEEWADRHKLSGARSSRQTARGAFEERQLIRPSAGTWGVSVREVEAEGSRLIDDTACPPPQGRVWPTGHTYLDLRFEDDEWQEQLRMNLAGAASRHRRLYPPSDS
jgi:hypothetical protein